jgi:protein-S-isoprenylcysteine O-methyltransferase Ste14
MAFVGSLLFALLAGLRARQAASTGDLLTLFLAAQAGLAALFLVVRLKEGRGVPFAQQAVAWGAALLPFLMQSGGQIVAPFARFLSGLGLALAVWSLVVLGKSFGVAPADRGLVMTGPYAWVRHPMYLGELISYLAFCLAWPNLWNFALLAVLMAAVLLRIGWEESVVSGYTRYARDTHWRLIYGVW